jgi:reactive intermediate/imine deaminase
LADLPLAINTDRAPQSSSPISQGIRIGELIFVSGQVGLDPVSLKKVTGGIEAETERALKNISAVLEQAGASMANVVKTTCFIADNSDFPRFNVSTRPMQSSLRDRCLHVLQFGWASRRAISSKSRRSRISLPASRLDRGRRTWVLIA